MIDLSDLGWDERWASVFAEHAPNDTVPARVAIEFNHIYRVITADGELQAQLAGRLRHQALGRYALPAVGDWVAVRRNPGEDTAVIEGVLPRRSKFSRRAAGELTEEQVVAANIDTVFLVSALDHEFNPRRVERYLLLAAHSGATPVVILNKADIAGPHVADAVELIGESARGVAVLALSAKTGEGLDALQPYLGAGQTVALLGSSGVGKSSIINTLAGEEVLRTRAVRASDSRGRHTSTHRQMVRLPGGALLIDTPGMRELQLWDVGESVQETFDDIAEIAAGCRFRDCRHRQEPGCAVKAAVAAETLPAARLEAYLKLEAEREAFEARLKEKDWK